MRKHIFIDTFRGDYQFDSNILIVTNLVLVIFKFFQLEVDLIPAINLKLIIWQMLFKVSTF